MRIGGAITLIVVGAILDFAVSVKNTHGFDINTIGLILLVVGLIWLVAEVIYSTSRRRTDVVHRRAGVVSRTTYEEPPVDPRV